LRPDQAVQIANKRISGLENIPVLSYLFLKGKCKGCQCQISPRYPIVELMSALLLGIIASKFGVTSTTLAASLFALALLTLALIDLDTHLLPDDITLPLLWVGLIFNLNHGFTDIQTAVIGVAQAT
jgi:leader peptidase (prepilin peptidase)/N-methyltransferase